MSDVSDTIINTTDENFERDVLDRSELGLVIVDFWADWCAPCRALAPILEQLTKESEGQFTLVKADTETCGGAAGAFGVTGIPAVYAVAHRQIVEHFSGALPESELREWLHRAAMRFALSVAQQLVETDPDQAEQKLRKMLVASPDDAEILTTLAAVLLDQQRDQESRELIEKLQSRGFLEPAAEKILAALDLHAKPSLDVDAARSAVTADPANADHQFNLAAALIGQEAYTEAFDICLSLIEHDRQANGERARVMMVEVFQALPPDSPLTNDYRRQLSRLLY